MATVTEQLNQPMQNGTTSDAGKRICFICTGNTCRSPMAAAIANALAKTDGLAISACSAGLYASAGAPISEHAVSALERAEIAPIDGMDYHAHTAQNLTAALVAQSDWLIPMTPTHAMELMMRYPDAVKKIVCMPRPISDPFGGDLRVYEACLSEITDGVRALLRGEV